MIDRDPLHLHPSARVLMFRHQEEAKRRLGVRTTCIETWRDPARQDLAFAAGLTDKRAGGSHHNITGPAGEPASCGYHLAIDPDGPLIIGFGSHLIHPAGCRTIPVHMGNHGVKDLSPEELQYVSLGLIGEELGLTSGMRWNVRGRGPDWTDFQITAPLSHIVAQIAAGKILA